MALSTEGEDSLCISNDPEPNTFFPCRVASRLPSHSDS